MISIPLISLSGSISPFPSSSSDPLFSEDFWSPFASPIVFHQLAAIRKQSNVEVRDASYLLQFSTCRSLDLQNTNCPNKFWKIIYSWKSVHILAKQCRCHFNLTWRFVWTKIRDSNFAQIRDCLVFRGFRILLWWFEFLFQERMIRLLSTWGGHH